MIRHDASLTELATLMKNRQMAGQSPFLLVLGSNYFGSFADIIRRATNASEANFSHFFSLIKSWSPDDRVALIKRYFDKQRASLVCQNVSALIQSGFVDTVITTSYDSTLEDTLLNKGFNFDELRVHIIGVESDNRIRSSFIKGDNKVHIFRLYGGIQYPDSIRMNPSEQMKALDKYRDELRDIFTRDLILYGYVAGYDQSGLAQFVTSQNESSVWIVQQTTGRSIEEESSLWYNLENRITSLIQVDEQDFFGELTNVLLDNQPKWQNAQITAIDTPNKSNSLKSQLAEAILNLQLIEEREIEYVIPAEIPLQLVKAKRHWKIKIGELEQQLRNAGMSTDNLPNPNLAAIEDKLDLILAGQEKISRNQDVLFKKLDSDQLESVNTIMQRLHKIELSTFETDQSYGKLLDEIRNALVYFERQQQSNVGEDVRQILEDSKGLLDAGVDIQTGLELTIPIIPLFLNYKLNLDSNTGFDLSKLWEKIKNRFGR